ncbi:hypothetical protein [Caballeronia sordidicola]|uniref:hypothetical protein n=1 Tax=Caballeronia sordidicola TaxID=196367 RepID=UPI00068BDB11|nr:hypothetical protein [Caballeronia sordidicola]
MTRKFVIGSASPIALDTRSDMPVRRRLTAKEFERNFSPIGMAIRESMITSIQAMEHHFDLLPIPVRYRASGAIDAWTAVRRLAGREGAKFSAALADPRGEVMDLSRHLCELVRHCLGEPPPDEAEHEFADIYTRSAFSQAFWLRRGALYEPTAALHRLLEVSDIASDVPLSLLRLPAPAICIVPEPALRDHPNGFKAVMVFEHCAPCGWEEHARWLTFCVWPHEDDPYPKLHVQSLSLYAGADSGSVEKALSHVCERYSLEGEALASWQRVLDYVVKVLLYLSLDVSPVIHERPYSTAPRKPAALGKRKRLEQHVARESLYDRYVVGPAALPERSEPSGSSEGSDRETRAHWRRGHFRMQAHGPAAARRKLILVMPVLVRADRLGSDCLL